MTVINYIKQLLKVREKALLLHLTALTSLHCEAHTTKPVVLYLLVKAIHRFSSVGYSSTGCVDIFLVVWMIAVVHHSASSTIVGPILCDAHQLVDGKRLVNYIRLVIS